MPAPVLIAGAFKLLEKGLDVIFPDPVKKAEALALLKDAEGRGDLQQLDAEVRQEMERTKRQVVDMKSDSWLSKNIRPGTMIYLLITATILALTDGNLQWTYDEVIAGEVVQSVWEFQVKDSYISLFTTLLVMFAGIYATGRSVEKAVSIFKG